MSEHQSSGEGGKMSGSCSATCIVLDHSLIVVNLGDSRVVASVSGGDARQITRDHKPRRISEFERIVEAGGQMYRVSQNPQNNQLVYYHTKSYTQMKEIDQQVRKTGFQSGPWRIKPGKLSVSRSFGDLQCKSPKRCLVAKPDLADLDIDELDFVLIGSDGLFDECSNQVLIDLVWKTIGYHRGKGKGREAVIRTCVDNLMKLALLKRAQDNISVILLFFKDLF